MNESTYRKYGSTKNNRLFIHANALTTDVLQFVRRLEGDYEVNGSFRVTNNLTVNRNLKLVNTDATLQSDAEISTAKGRVYVDASRHLQLSESTNLFLPNALHFTNHDSYVSDRGANRVMSLLARRDKMAWRQVKDGLLLSDDRIQLSAADSFTTGNQDLNLYPHSSASSYQSSFSIETQNPQSQLHCLYTGTDFRGRSVLADSKNANVRISASVNAADVASLALETHETATTLGALKFFVNTRTPELPNTVDDLTSVVLPSSATRHIVPQFAYSATDTSSFLFGGGPIVAGFNGKMTHSSVADSFPSLFARNRLEVVSTKGWTGQGVNPSVRLAKHAEEESEMNLVPQLLNPALSNPHLLSTACLSLGGAQNQVELTRFPDFHRVVGDSWSYPASFSVSADGRKLAVGKSARAAVDSLASQVFESAGTASFKRPGARAHLQHSLQSSDALLPTMKAYLFPPSPPKPLLRNYFYGRHLALMTTYPIANGMKYTSVAVYKHPIYIRYTTNIATGTYTWISRDTLTDDSLELESLGRPLSINLLLPYTSTSTEGGGHLSIASDFSDFGSNCALILGHLSNFQSIRFFGKLTDLDSYKLLDIAGGLPGSLFIARNDLNICSLNMRIGDKAFFRTVTFATSGSIGYVAVQVFDFQDGQQQLSTDGFNAQPTMVPMTADNAHRLMTFPMRAVPILGVNGAGDVFACTFFEQAQTSNKLSFRLLQHSYSYDAAAVTPAANKWSVSLSKLAESMNSVEVPATVLQRVAERFSLNLALNPTFRVPLYLFSSTTASGTSVLEAAGAITFSYLDPALKSLVVCIDSAWCALVQFGDLATGKQTRVSSCSLVNAVGEGLPLQTLRSVVLQPVKVWRDVRGRCSTLFLNLACFHANTGVPDLQGSVVQAATFAQLDLRLSKMLRDELPVMLRWDVDELGDTVCIKPLYLKSDVDADGEWARMLELTLESVRQQESTGVYSTDPSATSFRSPCFGTMGMLFPDGGADAARDLEETRRNGAWIQRKGDLCVEIFGAGCFSLDLQSFNPLTESSSVGNAAASAAPSPAVRLETGDLVLRGDSRILGEKGPSGIMVIAPMDTSVPLLLGSRGELELNGSLGKKQVLVRSDHTVHASTIRGPTLEQMVRQRRLEAQRGYEYESFDAVEGDDAYTDERLTIGGDSARPLKLFLCPEDSGTISTGDITMRNATVTTKLTAQNLFESSAEAVFRNIRGTVGVGQTSASLRIQGREDLTAPLTLLLGKTQGDLTEVGTLRCDDLTTPTLTVRESLVSESEASFPYIRGASSDATNVKAELRIEGTPSRPLELFLCQNEGDRVIMGTVVSSANSSSVMAVQELYVQNSATLINKSKAIFASDLTCTGDEIILGSTANTNSSIALNATTTTFMNASPLQHGAQIQDGLLCQW